ncbi:hypothetical protein IPA_03620 [Ignicoccus pacificus DSM 13166]|uniref:Glutamine amidotransferase type-2 domain-containing protein n=1 Tax=Ignicoccus pacificus DSM 13166 TaxID=940294 RepID=A0A977KB04_9CREN|nr:hypothetical protein IPA_03620 [Ignicoccus pacificus DSM 13166]
MCRVLGGVGRARYLNPFIRIAFRDSKGRSHPDGWGFAVHSSELKVFKTLNPIWERPRTLPLGKAFIVHARRAEKLPKTLEHVQPHLCEGVVLAHNGGVRIPMSTLKDFFLAGRSASERLSCLFGKLLRNNDVEKALSRLSDVVEPSPSANFVALIPERRLFVAYNYHKGSDYYVMWVGDRVVASERLREGWKPLSESGEPKWIVWEY